MQKDTQAKRNWPEIWAGLECTVNRVDDQYLNQLEWNGHAARAEDIARFAALGIRKMRYPVLWELTAPEGPEKADWTWTDQRLDLLRKHGIDPVAGFVHHGSGPEHTSLAKPCFAEGLTAYAKAFAQRYPWVQYYTPVNEPLTTARFSGLYGLWYPHGRDGFTFARCLIHQCRATVESMRVIREVNPSAKLVQTEDLGKTYSTSLLAYQAEQENERRWLTLDLLTGKLTPDRIMWGYLKAFGVTEEELQWFIDNPCPPDIIGINHYPTSERYLDENLNGYPEWSHGGNEYHSYADVHAVRVSHNGPAELYAGHYTLLKETWERYQLPVAVTEVHICGPREEQLRWLQHTFRTAVRLREEGVNICAVTAWSLLGTFDWINLVTRNDGYYEPGVYDVRGPQPRPTALARMILHLSRGEEFQHPLLDLPGWWQRSDRFCYPFPSGTISPEMEEKYQFGNGTRAYWNHNRNPACPTELFAGLTSYSGQGDNSSVRPVVITGATSTAGNAYARLCAERGIPYRLLNRQELDITDATAVARVLDTLQPWALINAAGATCVNRAEKEPEAFTRMSLTGSVLLAKACAKRSIALINFSTDWVFDGRKNIPYLESDPVTATTAYGRSKAEAEKAVLRAYPQALVIRAGALFGPWDNFNPLTHALTQLQAGNPVVVPDSRVHSPTYLPDLVHTSLDLLVDGENGIWHLANPGAFTWVGLVKAAAELLGLSTSLIKAAEPEPSRWHAGMKRNMVLESERGSLLPALEDGLARYCQELERKMARMRAA
jgi:dTDP-4-dehydrorhamnose reductase